MKFTVPGPPVPWARAGRKGGFSYTPTHVKNFENRVRLFAHQAGVTPLEGPVEILVRAIWPMKGQPLKRSKRPWAWKATRPDIDNVLKGVLDALNGIAYQDDGQVVRATIEKIHAAQGEPAETVIDIREAAYETRYTAENREKPQHRTRDTNERESPRKGP